MRGKYIEQQKTAFDGSENTLRTTDKKNLHGKLISTPLKFQRSPKKDIAPNKHQLRRPSGKYVSASEKTQTNGRKEKFWHQNREFGR